MFRCGRRGTACREGQHAQQSGQAWCEDLVHHGYNDPGSEKINVRNRSCDPRTKRGDRRSLGGGGTSPIGTDEREPAPTRDIQLGIRHAADYQLSYSRLWCVRKTKRPFTSMFRCGAGCIDEFVDNLGIVVDKCLILSIRRSGRCA